jgi:hypothetical protein
VMLPLPSLSPPFQAADPRRLIFIALPSAIQVTGG